MTRIDGRLIYTIPKWRFATAKCALWPIAWVYAFGLLTDPQLDKITERLARFVCGDVRKNARIVWDE